jgi:hemolysin activation/secretion protein
MGFRSIAIWLASAMAIMAAPIASAQTSSGAATDAGRIEQRFTPQTPRPAPGLPELPAAPLPSPATPGKAGAFMLASVDIEGSSVYQPSDLVPIYEPFLGHMTDLAGVQKIVEAITAKYRSDGYFLSRAEAPP